MKSLKLDRFHPLILILPLIVFIIILITIIIMSDKKLEIFPSSIFYADAYADNYENGNSEIISFNKNNDQLIMAYVLKKGHAYPYAGLSFNQKKIFSIKEFDNIKIKISSSKSDALRLSIVIFLKKYTSVDKPMSFLYLVKKFPVSPEIKEYTFALKTIDVPTWWYDLNKLEDYNNDIKKDFGSIQSIKIENDNNQKMDITDTIIIEKFVLAKNKFHIYVISLVFLFFYILVFIVFNIYKKNKQNVIPYKSLEINNYADEETKKLLLYLGENYNDPDLSVDKASIGSRISIFKIPRILKNNFNLTFPQYLNNIRINEAKRLLVETDRQIIEIALFLGYNNITHFNKIFKKISGVSPSDFRKKHLK